MEQKTVKRRFWNEDLGMKNERLQPESTSSRKRARWP